jgi:uncharacterized protein YjiK
MLGVLVAIVGCATTAPTTIEPFLDDAKGDGPGKRLTALEEHRLRVDEPSDLVFARDQLFTVSDAHSKLYAISRSGDVEDVIDVTGNDLEAVAYDVRTDEFLLADESRARVWRVDRDGVRQDSIDIDNAADANSGIEGLAFDADGHLFVAKEKDPARIYELDRDGFELQVVKIDFASDLSALAWDPATGFLYALSDEENALFRLDDDLDPTAAWRLPIEQPEGLAFENGMLYVASDSDERIYLFAFDM